MPIRFPDTSSSDSVATLQDVIDACHALGARLASPDGLAEVAPVLRALGNDRSLIGDRVIAMLKQGLSGDRSANRYSPQVIMLYPPDGQLFIRANVWPSAKDPMFRAAGASSFFYGMPHDHAFDFLTLGYHGPGYWSDYYEYDGPGRTLLPGDIVPLRFVERSRLAQGDMLLYRANVDVHDQHPADALSLSVNIMPLDPAHGWRDQYLFDLRHHRVIDRLTTNSARMMLTLCLHFGDENAVDLAHAMMGHDNQDGTAIAAFDALSSVMHDAALDALVDQACRTDNPLLRRHALMTLQSGPDSDWQAASPQPT